MSIVFILLLTILVNSYTNARFIKSTSHLEEESSNSNIQNWLEETLGDVKSKLHLSLNTNKAKNVIFFMGDGMSVTTITAARIYQGQLKNKSGEEHVLSFEKFPAVGLSKTYCSDQQTVDSGASATAFLAGVKANIFTIGVNSNVKRFDCVAAKDPANRPSNIIDWAQDAGKATGIISSARITDASPAGGYAHVPDRWMESDYDVFKAKMDSSCDFDIAKQLVREDPGKNIKVLMGGGIQKFLPNTTTDVFGKPGERFDTDLIEEWKRDKSKRNLNAKFITQRSDLLNLDISRTDYLLGLFATAHMHYHLENIQHEPTLEEMTTAAIKILQKEDKGFVLYIEGAFIDKAHHENRARLAIDETVELAKAVEAAVKLTNEEDTLIVVTADHSQPLVMNGYAKRGHDILGVTSLEQLTEQDERIKNVFNYNLKYTTLNYGNGPGFSTNIESDLKNNVDIKNMNYRYPSLYAFKMSSHAGEDVPVYARGPWSHLFSGIYEQTLIPIAEAYAADIGPSKAIKEMQESSRSNAYLIVHSQILIVFIIFVTNLI